jgi:hypothetical protein
MPPRYAYWTILVDGGATAFRARDREELLPTFNQLRRKSADVQLRYFSRGKLWDSPEQAQWAGKHSRPVSEARGHDWRPGGSHKDPRAFKPSPGKERRPPRRPAAPPGGQSRPADERRDGRPDDRKAHGPSRPPHRPGDGKHLKPAKKFGARPAWTPKPTDRKPHDPEHKARPPRPVHKPSGQARGFDRGDGAAHGGRERKPWTPKSSASGARPSFPEKRPWTPKSSEGHAPAGRKPKFARNDRPGGKRPWPKDDRTSQTSGHPKSGERRPWTPRPSPPAAPSRPEKPMEPNTSQGSSQPIPESPQRRDRE